MKIRIIPKGRKLVVQIGIEVFVSHEPFDRSKTTEWRNARPEDLQDVLDAIRSKEIENEKTI